MQVIADVGNPDYYELRAIELISEARKFPSEYDVKINQAIGLLALAAVTRRNGT